jgi:hypothetical protein
MQTTAAGLAEARTAAPWNTGCRMITNTMAHSIHIVNGENAGYKLTLAPGQERSFEGVLFPWCGDSREVKAKAFRVYAGSSANPDQLLFYIFQKWDARKVYFSDKYATWETIRKLEDLPDPEPLGDLSIWFAPERPYANRTPDGPIQDVDRRFRISFELFTYPTFGVGSLAEHTYLKCPTRPEVARRRGDQTPGGRYFQCYGSYRGDRGSHGVHRRTYTAYYAVADAYRTSAYQAGQWCEDTAGNPVYLLTGVCHQAANRFLYSGGSVIALADGIKSYLPSFAAYGPYGAFPVRDTVLFYAWFRGHVYDPAWAAHGPLSAGLSESEPPSPLFRDINLDYEEAIRRVEEKGASVQTTEHDLIHRSTARLVHEVLPDLDTDAFREVQLAMLDEKDAILAAGIEGPELAARINRLSADFQSRLAARIGEDTFRRLTGYPSDEATEIADPAIAASSTPR